MPENPNLKTWVVTLAQPLGAVDVEVQAETRPEAIEEIWRQFGISVHIVHTALKQE